MKNAKMLDKTRCLLADVYIRYKSEEGWRSYRLKRFDTFDVRREEWIIHGINTPFCFYSISCASFIRRQFGNVACASGIRFVLHLGFLSFWLLVFYKCFLLSFFPCDFLFFFFTASFFTSILIFFFHFSLDNKFFLSFHLSFPYQLLCFFL